MTNGATSTAGTGGQAPNGNIEKRLATLEAVLPTLATKVDLAELRSEMRVQNEALLAEMRVQNEKLRAEMRVQNEQLRTETQVQNEKLRTEMQVQNEQLRTAMQVQHEQLRTAMQVQHEQLRTEMRQLRADTERMFAGLYKWMLATILTVIIVAVGLGNILISRVSTPGAAPTSTSIGAGAAPATSAHTHNPFFPVRFGA